MRALAVPLLLLIVASPAAAADAVSAGDRIRYVPLTSGGWTEAQVLEAHVLDTGGEIWLVRPASGEPTWLRKEALRRVDVFRETGPWVKEGFLIGFVPGAILGASAAEYACLDPDPEGYECPGITGRFIVAAALGGTTGGIGALIGRLIKPEQWDPVIGGKVRVSVAPTVGPRGRGVGASLSVSF